MVESWAKGACPDHDKDILANFNEKRRDSTERSELRRSFPVAYVSRHAAFDILRMHISFC
jgi:hypothetical protein